MINDHIHTTAFAVPGVTVGTLTAMGVIPAILGALVSLAALTWYLLEISKDVRVQEWWEKHFGKKE